jgi:hypothetical protein
MLAYHLLCTILTCLGSYRNEVNLLLLSWLKKKEAKRKESLRRLLDKLHHQEERASLRLSVTFSSS